MPLPSAFDPVAVELCATCVRHALSGPRWDHLPAIERQAIVEHSAEKMMAAGAYVSGGRLFMPALDASKQDCSPDGERSRRRDL